MFTLNREGQDTERLSKIGLAVLEIWLFEVIVNPYYFRHPKVGNSARIRDIILENSPFLMYIDVHKMSFL